ncbi:MAG: DUF4276 family protein [Cyanobacteriota bacterium]|nr:DUF4276 family protein [Cyanobacteriota bacterium]
MFEVCYQGRDREIAALQAILNKYETPELINDGADSAPSKRIIAQFPEYKRGKANDGPQLAESIGLETIRSKCPHFNAWLSKLEALGDPNESRTILIDGRRE